MRDDLAGLARTLAANVLATGGEGDAPALLVARWEGANRDAMDRASRLLGELRAAPAPDLAMLSVGLRELRNLA
jgi:glutamate dehydrogenase